MKQELYRSLCALLAMGLMSGCVHPQPDESHSAVVQRSMPLMPQPLTRGSEATWVEATQPLTNNVTLGLLTTIALRGNPELRVFEAEIAAARGEVITARTWDNPELSVARRITHETEGSRIQVLHGQIGLQQTILFPGKRALQHAVAQKNVEIHQVALAGFRSQLRIQVRRAYFTLLAAQQVLPLREQRLTLAKTFVEAAKKRVDAGIAPEFEATKAEVEVVNAQTALRLAEAGVLTARTELNVLMGRKPEEPLLVSGVLGPDVQLPDTQYLLGQTLARNPSLKVQSAEVERTGLSLRLVQKSRYPDFTVGPGFETEPGLQVFSFGLSVPLTLWDKKKGPIATATAEQERAIGELEKLRQEILGRVTTAQQNLAAVKETLTNYTPEFLGRLKAALDAASQSYSEGRTPLLLFLETQRTYFETQASYFESLERLYQSQAELESAVGVPLDEIPKP